MKQTRRRFLKVAVVGTVSTAMLFVAGKWSYVPLRNRIFQLSTDVPPGPLDEPTQHTLVAIVDTLIGAPFESQHYQDNFAWYAATIPGYRGLYQRTTRMLDGLAAPVGGHAFADLASADRRRLIDRLLDFQGSKLRKMWMATINRDAVLFDQYIVYPVLSLYRETDAWIHLGYESWRGQPRGLIDYTRAPRALGQARQQRT